MTHSWVFSSETTVPLDGTLGKVEKLLCKALQLKCLMKAQ